MDPPTQSTPPSLDAGEPPASAIPAEVPARHGGQALLGADYRAATIGIVGLVSVVALEAMGTATVMPAAANALGGLRVYGLLFGGPLAVGLVGMVLAGLWSDRHGPMRAVWTGTALFLAGLGVAALATDLAWLLVGRLLTGAGSGMVGVALYALVGRVYPPALHSRIFAAFAAAWMLPALLGPALAGMVAQGFGWRYGIALPALLGLPAALLLTRIPVLDAVRPDDGNRRAAVRLAWACGAAAAALALHSLGQAGADAGHFAGGRMATLPLLAGALLLLAMSARHLLPPGSLAARPGLPAAIALSGLSQGAFFAAEAFLPLLMHRERGTGVAVAGLVLSAGAVSWSGGAFLRARLHARVPVEMLLRCGFGLLAAGITLSAAILAPAAPMAILLLGWSLAGAGMGLVSPTLSVVTLALASAGAQGLAGASLRLSAALATTSTLAISGAAFAILLSVDAGAAYLASLGIAAVLAFAGLLLAGRVAMR